MLRILAIGYPLVCHISVVSGHAVVAAFWLWGLLTYLAFSAPRRRWFYGVAVATIAAVALSAPVNLNDLILRTQPVAVTGMFAVLFGQSLMPGKTPLIVRIGEYYCGELPPAVAKYGRRLTVFWFCLFVLLIFESVLLGIFGTVFWWSLFTNFINYLIILFVFVAEYAVRRRVLSEVEHEPFIDYVAGITRIGSLGAK